MYQKRQHKLYYIHNIGIEGSHYNKDMALVKLVSLCHGGVNSVNACIDNSLTIKDWQLNAGSVIGYLMRERKVAS